MRSTVVLGLVLATAFTTPALAQSFLGKWTATAHLQGGVEVSETLDVVKTGDGYAITGRVVGDGPDTPQGGPGADIKIDGDKFSYTRAVSPDGSIKITYKGVVSGDVFNGEAELVGTSVPYSGVRIRTGK